MFSKVYTLRYEQHISARLTEVWDLFSDPKNLSRITPSWLDFQVLSATPTEMYEGQIIHYSLKPLFGRMTSWMTEITHLRAPHYFVDEQRAGPYALWHHQHLFRETDKRVEMIDELNIRIGYSIFDAVIAPYIVLPKVESIFEFRRLAIAEIFPDIHTP